MGIRCVKLYYDAFSLAVWLTDPVAPVGFQAAFRGLILSARFGDGTRWRDVNNMIASSQLHSAARRTTVRYTVLPMQ